MEKINELKWFTIEGSDYPVAKTIINGIDEISITKYDEDSYAIQTKERSYEANLSQLEKALLTEEVTNLCENDPFVLKEITAQEGVASRSANTEIPSSLTKMGKSKSWKNIAGIGENVLEIPHIQHANGKLRIIKLDDDSYKVAVIGVPPNDGTSIRYEEVSLRFAILNYADAIGVDLRIAEEYFKTL